MTEPTAAGSDVAPDPSADESPAPSCHEDTIAARGGILGADCCAGDD